MKKKLPEDTIVRLVDLPTHIGGMVSESPDGVKNIYLNARRSTPGQHRSLDHEIDHIEHDDLHSDAPIEIVEPRRKLPKLMRASDLKPPKREITLYQFAVALDAVRQLDEFLGREEPHLF